MLKRVFIIIAVLSLQTVLFAHTEPDTTRSIFEKGLDQIKLQKARHLFMVRSYDESIAIYEEMSKTDPTNPLINFRMGECYFEMKKYEVAITYLEKSKAVAEEVGIELLLYLGRAYHRLEDLDKAETSLKQFKGLLTDKLTDKFYHEEVDKSLKSVQHARSAMAAPINVTITNIGDRINTANDDYGPAISADGRTLIFSSRRADTKGGLRDPNDNKFMEDIYMSTWDTIANAWLTSESIKGRINTEDHDGCLSLSPDGQELYVYRNEGDAGNGAGDIYVAHAGSSGKWSAAKKLTWKVINTTYFESSASVTQDNAKLFFVSERIGGLGSGDIWIAEKISRSEWGTPVNAGKAINTDEDERMVFIHPDGQTMFFSSDGHNTMGGYDIFMSKFVNGNWSTPINLGYPINTVNDEVNFTLTQDGKKAYTSALKTNGMGGMDIYEIDLSNLALLDIKDVNAKQEATITGVIKDAEGQPIAGCTVDLIEVGSNNKLGSLTTTEDGRYQFTAPTKKSYRFIAKKTGYITTESSEIKLTSTETIEKDLTLVR